MRILCLELRSSKHEEQAYNSCAGVLHSCKDVPHRLIQEAAEKCVETNACKYSYFKKVLGMVQNNHSSSGINNGAGKLNNLCPNGSGTGIPFKRNLHFRKFMNNKDCKI